MLTPHGECSLSGCAPSDYLVRAGQMELDYTAQPGHRRTGPLSDMRQHGLYDASDPGGDTGWRAGVLTRWLWARDRATFEETALAD